jgi:hypothetical protein
MSLTDQLLDDLKAAMRQRDETRVSVIRMVRAAITNAEIDRHGPLDDAAVLSLIERDAKRHRESIAAFRAGNRADLVAKEEAELTLLLSYLPEQLSREEIAAAARTVIAEAGATGPTAMGKVMSILAPRLKGKADGRLASQVVSELLK